MGRTPVSDRRTEIYTEFMECTRYENTEVRYNMCDATLDKYLAYLQELIEADISTIDEAKIEREETGVRRIK